MEQTPIISTSTATPEAQDPEHKQTRKERLAEKAERAKKLRETNKAERAARKHPGIHTPHAKFRTIFIWMILALLAFSLISTVAGDLYFHYVDDVREARETVKDGEKAEPISAYLGDPTAAIGLGLIIYGIIAAWVALSHYSGKIVIHENTHKFWRGLFKAYISRWNVLLPLIAGFIVILFFDYFAYVLRIFVNQILYY